MPIIETTNTEVKDFAGLHLYHFWLSSCSQRVRTVLSEKGLDWTSHEVNLPEQEHATPAYQSINPNGVVPTLVHDGQVIIESIDIIDYLDIQFPTVPLRPKNPEQSSEMQCWLAEADAAQGSIKVLTHEFLFKPNKMSTAQFIEFSKTHRNTELVEFMRVWCSDSGIPRSDIESALQIQLDSFDRLNTALATRDWLVGNTFSLADIAWISNVRRLDIMLYPLEIHPNLNDWYLRFQKKPCYSAAISNYEIVPVIDKFQSYNKSRNIEGTGVTSYLPLNRIN